MAHGDDSTAPRHLRRRAFLGMVAAAAGSGILAACGGESGPATSVPAAPVATTAPAATTGASAAATMGAAPAQMKASGTVKFWHVWGGDRQPLIEKSIADFESKNPGLKVEHTVLSQMGLQEKYLTAIAGGQPPDVMMLNTRDLPNFAARNALRGVDDLIARDKFDVKSTFFPGDVGLSTFREKLYGLPLTPGGGNFLIFWNKAQFKEVGLDPEKGPKTWTEFADYAKKLTKGSGGTFERIGSLFWSSDGNLFREWAATNAGTLYSPDGLKVQFDAKENVEALQYMVDNLEANYGGYEKIRSFATQPGAGGGEGNQSFFQGKIAMHFSGVYHFLQLSKEAPMLQYGVTVHPYNDKNPAAKAAQFADGIWNYVLPKGVKNPDGAWELVKYFCAGQGQLDFFKAQGRPAVVAKYNEDPAYSKDNPNWAVVQQSLMQAVSVPVTPVYPEDMTILSNYTEQALLKKLKPADALKMATAEAQRVHDDKLMK